PRGIDGQSDDDFKRTPDHCQGECTECGFYDEFMPQADARFFEKITHHLLDYVYRRKVQEYTEKICSEQASAVYLFNSVLFILDHICNAFIKTADFDNGTNPGKYAEEEQKRQITRGVGNNRHRRLAGSEAQNDTHCYE